MGILIKGNLTKAATPKTNNVSVSVCEKLLMTVVFVKSTPSGYL